MKRRELNFGDIDTVLLLGGGVVLSRFALEVQERGLRLAVFTGPRHLQAPLPDGIGPMREFLASADIPVVSCERIADEPRLSQFESPGTLALSLGAPWIFGADLIDRFESRLLNVHGAPLPEHRGAGGYSWRILMDDRRGASAIHVVDRGLDTGPIVKMEPYEFPASCRIPADFERHQHRRDLEFLREFLDEVQAGKTFTLTIQDDAASTYYPRLYAPKHGAIDWAWGARSLERFIRAFDAPYAGAFTRLGETRVVLRDARLSTEQGPFHPFQAGLVYRVHEGEAFIAAAAGGAVAVGSILDPEGRDVIGGHIIGTRLWTPAAWLEEAKGFRAVYLATGIKA